MALFVAFKFRVRCTVVAFAFWKLTTVTFQGLLRRKVLSKRGSFCWTKVARKFLTMDAETQMKLLMEHCGPGKPYELGMDKW